jgi:hypothetical protein
MEVNSAGGAGCLRRKNHAQQANTQTAAQIMGGRLSSLTLGRQDSNLQLPG